MKNLLLVLGFLLIPSVSSAQLTTDQANSLIAVVQSSTTTPANAFVPLITSFSSITVLQAESLINVVQKAPGVPADSFVDMLLAFTVDPAAHAPVVATAPTAIQTQTQPTFGSIQTVDNTPVVVAPVVQSVVMPATTHCTVDTFSRDVKICPTIGQIIINNGSQLVVVSEVHLDMSKTVLPTGITMGDTLFTDKPTLGNFGIGQPSMGYAYGVELLGLPSAEVPDGQQAPIIEVTVQDTEGNTMTFTKVIVR